MPSEIRDGFFYGIANVTLSSIIVNVYIPKHVKDKKLTPLKLSTGHEKAP
jgi:hypothetical protein